MRGTLPRVAKLGTAQAMRTIALVSLLVLAAGCPPTSTVPSPFDGQSRYLCCNLHYEKPKITDVAYQQGALVPLGTRVTITKVHKQDVTFEAPGFPPITLVNKYGRSAVPMDTFVNRWFVERDPKLKLKNVPKKTVELIQSGQVDKGMTRDQVLMSLGYPAPHRTPSLDSPQWTFWQNRWQTFVVDFSGDKVDAVRR
jgi:hypothetical protein